MAFEVSRPAIPASDIVARDWFAGRGSTAARGVGRLAGSVEARRGRHRRESPIVGSGSHEERRKPADQNWRRSRWDGPEALTACENCLVSAVECERSSDGWSELPCVSVVGLAPSELAFVRLAGAGLASDKGDLAVAVRRQKMIDDSPRAVECVRTDGAISRDRKGTVEEEQRQAWIAEARTSSRGHADTATMPSTLRRARSSMRPRSVSA